MPEINRSALVTYTPAQMYDLVRDVERYPDFLSWIVAARTYEESEIHQLASLDVSVAGISRRIVTRNDLVSGELVRLNLAEGPFRHFAGEWRFENLGIGCKIGLTLGFDFDNPVLVAAFSRGFVSVANRMVNDFCRRADQLYQGHGC